SNGRSPAKLAILAKTAGAPVSWLVGSSAAQQWPTPPTVACSLHPSASSRERHQERQSEGANHAVIGLLLFHRVDAITERFVNVLHLLGQPCEGLQLACDARDQLRVDAVLCDTGLD